MRDLQILSTSNGDIRLLIESAEKYRDIGIILLNGDSGAIVRTVKESARDNAVEAVRIIYEKWIEEDEDHTWKKLIQCFRDVQLNFLASKLELHFGLPSPSGKIIDLPKVHVIILFSSSTAASESSTVTVPVPSLPVSSSSPPTTNTNTTTTGKSVNFPIKKIINVLLSTVSQPTSSTTASVSTATPASSTTTTTPTTTPGTFTEPCL